MTDRPAPSPDDLGTETSGVLAEVRTVLSRARTALATLGDDPQWMVRGSEPIFGPPEEHTYERWDGKTITTTRQPTVGWTPAVTVPHPDGLEMVAALKEVVRLLEKWERAPRRKGVRS